MTVQLITVEDLQLFRSELLNDLKAILSAAPKVEKRWLKSKEVRKILDISPGTLQTFRINGTLSYTKVGGVMYYAQEEIDRLLSKNKVHAIPTLFK
jgi:hypothetical protein